MPTVTLFRPTGPEELELVRASGFTRWPPRLAGQPIFYPVTNEACAREISQQWNIRDSGIGYVCRFEVDAVFMAKYPIQTVGATHHAEWWVPAADLDQLNAHIAGLIAVIAEFRS